MPRKRKEEVTETVQQKKELSPSLEKTKMINALSSACSNPALLTALEKMECGDLLLEIFAKAINKKIEQLFIDNNAKDDIVENGVDRVIGKIGEIERSPVLAVLERLYVNMAQAQNSQVPPQRPVPQTPQAARPSEPQGNGGIPAGNGGGLRRGEGFTF